MLQKYIYEKGSNCLLALINEEGFWTRTNLHYTAGSLVFPMELDVKEFFPRGLPSTALASQLKLLLPSVKKEMYIFKSTNRKSICNVSCCWQSKVVNIFLLTILNCSYSNYCRRQNGGEGGGSDFFLAMLGVGGGGVVNNVRERFAISIITHTTPRRPFSSIVECCRWVQYCSLPVTPVEFTLIHRKDTYWRYVSSLLSILRSRGILYRQIG